MKVKKTMGFLKISLVMSKEYAYKLAQKARKRAYAPYSDYKVGACIETNAGLATGANIEISGRSTSVHAEMLALFNAVMDGATDFYRIAVCHDGDSGPCMLCLHTLSEFTEDIDIIIEVDGELEKFSLEQEYNRAYRPNEAEHHEHH